MSINSLVFNQLVMTALQDLMKTAEVKYGRKSSSLSGILTEYILFYK